MNVILVRQNLPTSIKAFSRNNYDDSYTIFINSSLSDEQQKNAILHEVKHILNDDFSSELHASTIEKLIRKNEESENIADINFFTAY